MLQTLDSHIPDIKYIKFEPKTDNRGYFTECFRQSWFNDYNFVQENESMSTGHVLRGLHFQKEPYAQTKLLRVVTGKIIDVIVDIRPDSPTFKQHISVTLSSDDFYYLLIPKGFAHGFISLSVYNLIQYKVDNYYNPDYDAGIRYDDPDLNIKWPIDITNATISDKDLQLPYLKDLGERFWDEDNFSNRRCRIYRF